MREFPPRVHVEFWNDAEDCEEEVIPATAAYLEPNDCTEEYLSLQEVTALRQADLEKIAALREALEELRMQAQVDARCGERTKDEKSWESLFHFERQKRIEEIDEALQATAPGEKPD